MVNEIDCIVHKTSRLGRIVCLQIPYIFERPGNGKGNGAIPSFLLPRDPQLTPASIRT